MNRVKRSIFSKGNSKPIFAAPSLTVKMALCILAFYFFAERFIEQQNVLYELRRKVPLLEQELVELQELVESKEYELRKYTSPSFLLKQKQKFSHLEFPKEEQVILLDDPENEQ